MEDRGPALLACVWLLTGLSGIFLFLRGYCKFSERKGFWLDDHILWVAWLACLAKTLTTNYAVALGSGKHQQDINPDNLANILLLRKVISNFGMAAVSLSKTSFAVTLLRLVLTRTRYFLWLVIVTTNAAFVANMAYVWVRCRDGKCSTWPNLVEFGVIVSSYSAAVDFALAIMAFTVICKLQIKPKEKIGVAVAMSLGVFVGAIAVVKTAVLATSTDADRSYGAVPLSILSSAESGATIISLSIPVLRWFIREVSSSKASYYPQEKKSSNRASILTIPTKPAAAHVQAPVIRSMSPKTRFDEFRRDNWRRRDQMTPALGRISRVTEIQVEFGIKHNASLSTDSGSSGIRSNCGNDSHIRPLDLEAGIFK